MNHHEVIDNVHPPLIATLIHVLWRSDIAQTVVGALASWAAVRVAAFVWAKASARFAGKKAT